MAGDEWGVAASSLVRAIGAAGAGDLATVGEMTAETLRHSAAIGYDAFQTPAMLLEAWVAERRHDRGAVEGAYRRALEVAGRAGFTDHAAFALAGLGSNALASGDLRQAEQLQRRALAAASRRPATLTPPKGCTGTSSSGRTRRGRATLVKASSSRSSAARLQAHCSVSPRPPTPAAMRLPPVSCTAAPGSRSPDPGHALPVAAAWQRHFVAYGGRRPSSPRYRHGVVRG